MTAEETNVMRRGLGDHFAVWWDEYADGILGPFFNPGVEDARVAQPCRPIRFHNWSPLELTNILP